MMRRIAPKLILALLVSALFLPANWQTMAARTSSSPVGIRLSLPIDFPCDNRPGCNELSIAFEAVEPSGAAVPPCFAAPAVVTFSVVRFDSATGQNVPGGTPPFIYDVRDSNNNPVPVTPLSTHKASFKATVTGPYSITATDATGCKVCAGTLKNGFISCGSLTQESFSNSSATLFGRSVPVLLDCFGLGLGQCGNITVEPKSFTVGKTGSSRSITFTGAAGRCVIQRLPASGLPTALPPGFGNQAVNSSTCQTPTAIPLDVNGKLTNALLGNTIALSLNTRFDMDLGSRPLCERIVTQRAKGLGNTAAGQGLEVLEIGGDNIFGTGDDPIQIVTISTSVITVLNILGLPRTVNGLLELANRALAGDANLGGSSLTDINAALIAINKLFDQTAFIINPEFKVNLWLGVKKASSQGIAVDLLAELYYNGELVGTGLDDSAPTGGAKKFKKAFIVGPSIDLNKPVSLCRGDRLELRLFARNASRGSARPSGIVRLWLNDSAANSRLDSRQSSLFTNYYFTSGARLSNSPGQERTFIDLEAGAPGSPFKLFGTWSINL